MYLFYCYRADKRAKEKEESMGFSVPGRPKNWRDKAFKVLEESVSNRLETFLICFMISLTPEMIPKPPMLITNLLNAISIINFYVKK